MSRKKETFSMNKWKDYRIQVMREEAEGEVIQEGRDPWKLADAVARTLTGNPKTGLNDISKFRNVISDYVDKDNFDDIFGYLVRELRDVFIDTMKRAAAGK